MKRIPRPVLRALEALAQSPINTSALAMATASPTTPSGTGLNQPPVLRHLRPLPHQPYPGGPSPPREEAVSLRPRYPQSTKSFRTRGHKERSIPASKARPPHVSAHWPGGQALGGDPPCPLGSGAFSLDLLRPIVSPGPRFFRGLRRLTVQDQGAGGSGSSFSLPVPADQGLNRSLPHPFLLPRGESSGRRWSSWGRSGTYACGVSGAWLAGAAFLSDVEGWRLTSLSSGHLGGTAAEAWGPGMRGSRRAQLPRRLGRWGQHRLGSPFKDTTLVTTASNMKSSCFLPLSRGS
jgi:hypothetical protein